MSDHLLLDDDNPDDDLLLEDDSEILLEFDPSSALDWQSIRPQQLPRKITHPRHEAVLLAPILPIPRPAPPTDFPLRAVYPDRVLPRISRGSHGVFVIAPILPPILLVDLAWLPSYPTGIRKYRLNRGQTTTFDIGVQIDVAVRGGWRPQYPSRTTRPRVRAGDGVWRVTPVIIDADILCMVWTDLALTTAALTPEVLTVASLIDEALTVAALTSEEFC